MTSLFSTQNRNNRNFFPSSQGAGFLGRSLRQGTMETFGWTFDMKGRSEGFAGWRATADDVFSIENGKKAFTPGKAALGTGLRLLGAGLNIFMVHSAYQEEGIGGALKAAAINTAFNTVGAMATSVLGAPAMPIIAGATALGAGAYALGEAGRAKATSLRTMEMGGGDLANQLNSSQGAFTARQQAVRALNNSHLNNRMALGNEGFLMHRTFA